MSYTPRIPKCEEILRQQCSLFSDKAYRIRRTRELDVELIREHMPFMDSETRARAQRTIEHLKQQYDL